MKNEIEYKFQNIQFWQKQVSTENIYKHSLFTYYDYDNNGVSYCSKRMYDFLTFQKKIIIK